MEPSLIYTNKFWTATSPFPCLELRMVLLLDFDNIVMKCKFKIVFLAVYF